MKKIIIILLGLGLAFGNVAVAQGDGTQSFVLANQGGTQEGHTPRGFQGMGTGLFAGDNLNPGFPNGDGVQIFLTFDLSQLPVGQVTSAILSSENFKAQGTPFVDLGNLKAEAVRYSSFSSALWNLEPVASGDSCVFASSANGPFACDLSAAVQQSLDDGYPLAQFRLRFEQVSDSDGQPDMAMFFKTNSNTNEPGLFELAVNLTPAQAASSQATPAAPSKTNGIITPLIILAAIAIIAAGIFWQRKRQTG